MAIGDAVVIRSEYAAEGRADAEDRKIRTRYEFALNAVGFAAERLNVLQFLTIRRYLSFVMLAVTVLLLVLAIWP